VSSGRERGDCGPGKREVDACGEPNLAQIYEACPDVFQLDVFEQILVGKAGVDLRLVRLERVTLIGPPFLGQFEC